MCLVFQHVNCTGNMRRALRPLFSLSYGRNCLSGEIIIVYVATQMHILPGGKWTEEEALCCHSGLFVGRLHKKPLHGIVNSSGLNESSFCVMPTSKNRKKKKKKKKIGGGGVGGRGRRSNTLFPKWVAFIGPAPLSKSFVCSWWHHLEC